jgi:hypothetical protein
VDAFCGRVLALALCNGHERILRPLLAPPLLLLLRAIGGAFTIFLIPLGLASGTVKNRSDCLRARGVAGCNVKELLGGLWALALQLVD